MSRYYDDELYHFGIKGMHWGVRRYQNANGSYTSAGKQRRRTGAQGRADRAKEEAASAHKLASKYTSRMDAKAAKRQAQADATGTRRSKIRAHRARDEAASAHKLASKYTSRMDAKAAKRQAKADAVSERHFSENHKKALKVGAAAVVTGLAIYGGSKYFGGKHSMAGAQAKSFVNKGKEKVSRNLKSMGTKAVNELKQSIKNAPGEVWNAGKEGVKKGLRDGAKVVGAGVAIYGAQKALEKKYGKQDAEKIVQYGRQPLKKK